MNLNVVSFAPQRPKSIAVYFLYIFLHTCKKEYVCVYIPESIISII